MFVIIYYDLNTFVQELPLPDIPIMMTLLEERPSGKLCVAYRQGYIDAINEINGETTRLLTLEGKVTNTFCNHWIILVDY